METDYDENVLEHWKVPNGNFSLNFKKDDGLEADSDVKNTIPSHLGDFILCNSKRIMDNFIRESNGFYNNSIYYGDTNSVYIEKKNLDVLDNAKLVGQSLCHSKNDYKSGRNFYGLFLTPKIKYVLTTDDFGIFQQNMTFKSFKDSKRLLDRSQYFNKLEVRR